MEIGVYYLQGTTVDQGIRDEVSRDYLKKLSAKLKQPLTLCRETELSQFDLGVLFVTAGGTEGKFLKIISQLPEPIFLLTSNENNSLAASMEILSYLKSQGLRGEIIHGDLDYCAQRLLTLQQVFTAKNKIKKMKLGCVGEPSDWLIASHVNDRQVKFKTGIEIVRIDMEEFFEEIQQNKYEENEYTTLAKTKGYQEKEIEKALAIYGALKRICQKYHLSGVTVRCFDLLEPIKNTGCLALAILNSEGIFAGCEGDIPSLISMTVLGTLSNQPVFLCNPSRIMPNDKEIIFAHCTLPITMPTAFHFMTHFESDLGVAIAGHIQEGPATVFKCAADFSRYYRGEGEIVKNLQESHLCRTQIQVYLTEGVEYFTTNPIGNHHLVVTGHVQQLLDEFFHWA